ncbi:YgcG family protein [Paucibacter sp. JuS9]|uniref:TPM domain-containing protein n=1 Tax=Paucibacter sp. JuS9 TaxID=3228748 RepID=UPI003757A551
MRWLLATLLLALALPAWAQELRPVPVLTARVIDQTGTLDALQVTSLENKLAAFEQQAGPQIVILMLPATAPEDIAAFAQRVGDAWKIGRRDVGDGLLIIVAKNERKVRIEVAKGLEGAVPDLAARQIIQNAITPAFKKGDYAGGLNQAVDQLQARIRGEALPAPSRKSGPAAATGGSDFDFETLAMLFFIGVPIVGVVLTSILGRKLGSLGTSVGVGGVGWLIANSWWIAGLAALLSLVLVGVLGIGSSRRSIGRRYGGGSDMPIIWGGGGSWSGGGGSSSDGGGFSSGGGGDFGGGGASGDW